MPLMTTCAESHPSGGASAPGSGAPRASCLIGRPLPPGRVTARVQPSIGDAGTYTERTGYRHYSGAVWRGQDPAELRGAHLRWPAARRLTLEAEALDHGYDRLIALIERPLFDF